MGKLALAAKITHVPSMYLSELPGKHQGCRHQESKPVVAHHLSLIVANVLNGRRVYGSGKTPAREHSFDEPPDGHVICADRLSNWKPGVRIIRCVSPSACSICRVAALHSCGKTLRTLVRERACAEGVSARKKEVRRGEVEAW